MLLVLDLLLLGFVDEVYLVLFHVIGVEVGLGGTGEQVALSVMGGVI